MESFDCINLANELEYTQTPLQNKLEESKGNQVIIYIIIKIDTLLKSN